MTLHKPVMVEEVLTGLAVQADGIYIDATFGRGGHSQSILNQLSSQGMLIALDKDPEAVEYAKQMFAQDERFKIVAETFSCLKQVASDNNVLNRVNGILIDLGVSSPQLDDELRGFSFSKAGPLDMRMNPMQGQSAAEWLMTATLGDIVTVLRDFGEERFAKRIATAIVDRRQQEQISTTKQLAEIIADAKPVWEKNIHPATKAFQAIRIYINRELEELEAVLSQSLEVLAKGGRLVVISFHSLEDRRVKRFLRNQSRDQIPTKIPIRDAQIQPPMKIIGKSVKATAAEVADNPRARSAMLRIGEKLQ